VKGPSKGGKPIVWIVRDGENYGDTMKIQWSENYGAFVSTQETKNKAHISSRTDMAVNLGGKLIRHPDGHLEVSSDGSEGTISIVNKSLSDVWCGLSEVDNDLPEPKFNPICLFGLDRKGTDLITPISRVVLMWAKDTIETATVIEKSLGTGIVVDLTRNNSRALKYDIDNAKWDKNDETTGYIEAFESDSELSPLLINPA